MMNTNLQHPPSKFLLFLVYANFPPPFDILLSGNICSQPGIGRDGWLRNFLGIFPFGDPPGVIRESPSDTRNTNSTLAPNNSAQICI